MYWMVNGSTSIIFSSRPHFIFHFLLSPDTMFSILFLTSLHENPLHAGHLLPVPAYSALGPQQSLIEEVLTKYHHGLSIHDHQCPGHGHCHSVSQASVKHCLRLGQSLLTTLTWLLHLPTYGGNFLLLSWFRFPDQYI